jgi:response regulator RpfG family c-di-GMP phosphodiesterase
MSTGSQLMVVGLTVIRPSFVDDNPTNLNLVSDILGFEGYSIQKAASAKEAQEVVRLSKPHLILLPLGGGGKGPLQEGTDLFGQRPV